MNRNLAAYTDVSGVMYPDYVSIEETPEGEVVFHVRGAAGQHHASVKMTGNEFAELISQATDRASDSLKQAIGEACIAKLVDKFGL